MDFQFLVMEKSRKINTEKNGHPVLSTGTHLSRIFDRLNI